MDNIAKYKLELKSKDETYARCWIGGLKNAYYKSGNDKLETFGGAVGLLKNAEYKGYCNLCMSHHTNNSENLPSPGYTVEFSPLYNEYGQMILVEYDRDEVFACVDRGIENYDKRCIEDAVLCFWNNGTFREFVKE